MRDHPFMSEPSHSALIHLTTPRAQICIGSQRNHDRRQFTTKAHSMKAHVFFLCISSVAVLVPVLAAPNAAARTADEIGGLPAEERAQAVVNELSVRNAGYKDMGGEVEMTLRDADGSESKRHFSLKVLERVSATAGDSSLITFDSPADVRGTAVLSRAGAGADEQWLYLPAANRVRRIAAANRANSFVGSEFTFEDLTASDSRKYNWRLSGIEDCGPLRCFALEATPKDPASAYTKRVLRVDSSEFRIQSTDFFDRNGAKLKTLAYTGYQRLNGKFWRSQAWTMKNHQSGKSTVLVFTSMRLGNGYSESDFASAMLGN
jgi:outer membrane lipoprotein-sorting protein